MMLFLFLTSSLVLSSNVSDVVTEKNATLLQNNSALVDLKLLQAPVDISGDWGSVWCYQTSNTFIFKWKTGARPDASGYFIYYNTAIVNFPDDPHQYTVGVLTGNQQPQLQFDTGTIWTRQGPVPSIQLTGDWTYANFYQTGTFFNVSWKAQYNRPQASGYFTSATAVYVNFPDATPLTASVTSYVIDWSNGAVWNKASGAPPTQDLTGDWGATTIAQSGTNIDIHWKSPSTRPDGTGYYTDPTHISINFPDDTSYTASVTSIQINWSSGAVWYRTGFAINLSGDWGASNIVQTGSNLLLHWKPPSTRPDASGAFTGSNTINMNFPDDRLYTATVTNTQIDWDSGAVWNKVS